MTLTAASSRYNGNYCTSSVSETFGSTKACVYATSNSDQTIVTHTFANGGKVERTYTILYDRTKKCALWASYAMHNSAFRDANVGRHDRWAYDPAIPQADQPDLGSSYDGGYSRGHQVASSDRQTTTEQNKQTFYYTNMTPQNQSLNSGAWNVLESKVQGLGTATSGLDTLYVVTGPVFESGYTTTRDDSGVACAVPTKYFKCLMKCTFDAQGRMTAAKGAAYLFNHAAGASRQDTIIDAIEQLTGFDFYANVPKELQDAAEATSYKFF